MFCQAGFDPWLSTINTPLPPWSQPQATVLALGSFGRGLARSCALRAVSRLWAEGMPRKEPTGRQPWRAWSDEARRTRGPTRHALHVETCVAPWRGGGVHWWQGTQRALASAATTWGPRCVVLAVRVVSRGCARPVAWGVLPAGAKHAWRRAGRRLRRLRRPALPHGWPVSGRADRGWQAPGLFRRITRLGWPPFLRIKTGGRLRPAGGPCWPPLARVAPRPGTRGRGPGRACTRPQVACTWLARGDEDDNAPWLLLTAGPPEASEAGGQGLRAWREPGVQLTKRAGWQWHRTRMRHPARAARLWRAVAGATVGLLRVGGAVDEPMPPSTGLEVPALCPDRPRTRRATRLRLVRVVRQGGGRLLVALRRPDPLPAGRWGPAPWPVVSPLEGATREPPMALPAA